MTVYVVFPIFLLNLSFTKSVQISKNSFVIAILSQKKILITISFVQIRTIPYIERIFDVLFQVYCL